MNTQTGRVKAASILIFLIGGLLGLAISAAFFLFASPSAAPTEPSLEQERKILYWVAPMDANYRRDKPGLSPMGMELVPVYEDNNTQPSPGAIKINPSVINKLGVRSSEAKLGHLDEAILTVGFVKYDENRLIHIHPRVSGWVDKLYVSASGDPVKKGAALYDLYSPELVNAQEEFVLAINRGNLRLIKGAEDKLRALQIPQSFINRLRKTKIIRQTVTFNSPQDGIVDNLNVREGFYVQPGTNLFSIGNLEQVWVEAEVFERQASLITVGAEVSMQLDYKPGKLWSGKVDYIYPTLNADTRTLRLRLKFDNPGQQLLPNMYAQVKIHSKAARASLNIPSEALIRTGLQDRVVLALGDGYFKSVEVKAGRESRESVEILQGLEAGDKIVTSAQFLIDSESSVNSDFKRMLYTAEAQLSDEHQGNHAAAGMQHTKVQSAEVYGSINSIDEKNRSANISRGEIKKWGRPAATMDFSLAEHIDINKLKQQPNIFFRFEIQGDDFVMVEFEASPRAQISNKTSPKTSTNEEHHSSMGAQP
ncbi:efflux RND transporter periplasmic adaptor subunit [Agaribacterium haliotis]|uniref:efflux RND transporter periplasmic adaptor subunit n=1 Tax=Agaribacterium haliotis TaxID=2013869 RepID=UPI000BB54C2D|nr:efflux RND transporter periplasmic adaptor subunit [Agaribacterium haliotis]